MKGAARVCKKEMRIVLHFQAFECGVEGSSLSMKRNQYAHILGTTNRKMEKE